MDQGAHQQADRHHQHHHDEGAVAKAEVGQGIGRINPDHDGINDNQDNDAEAGQHHRPGEPEQLAAMALETLPQPPGVVDFRRLVHIQGLSLYQPVIGDVTSLSQSLVCGATSGFSFSHTSAW